MCVYVVMAQLQQTVPSAEKVIDNLLIWVAVALVKSWICKWFCK